MDLPGVFQLVTHLCRSISEKYESQIKPLYIPTKSKRHKDKEIKELRSLAFDMLLFKCRPTSLNTGAEVTDTEMIDDPATDLLGVAITRIIKQRHEQAKKLSKCTDYLWKTGLSDDPLVKNGLKLLLNLVDEEPEENNQNKDFLNIGFLNIGYSFEPQISLNGEVPPYRLFATEMFEGTHLLNSLYGGSSHSTNINGDPFIYCTNPAPDVDFDKMPGTNSTIFEYSNQSQDQSSFHYQFPTGMNLPQIDQLLLRTSEATVEEATEKTGPLSQTMDDEDSLLTSDEFWEQVTNTQGSDFKTWETAGEWCPAKEKPFLSEAPFSYIYQVVLAAQLKVPLKEKKDLKFTIVESHELVRSLKLMMTGTESTIFRYDQEQDTFVIQGGICLEGLLPEGVATLSKDFVDCGVCYRRLRDFSSHGQSHGFVFQAFCLSVGNYLRTYDETILSVDEENVTMLTFLANIQQLKMNLLYLSQLCRIKHEEMLPTGGLLLTYLYQHIVHFSHQGLASMLLSCLRACSNVYLRFLEQWLFEGSCEDPYQEFFIQPNAAFSADRTRNYWKFAFVSNKHTVPIFLRDLEHAILDTGKAVNLMRLVVPRDPLLYLLQQSSPRLPCVMQAQDIPRLRHEYEIYHQRVMSVVGAVVSMKQQFQRDRDKEKAFFDRVRQVRQQRLDAMKAVRNARAQQEILQKQVRLQEWQEQMRIVTARKELEKQRQRELEAEAAEELRARRQEDDRLREEERQKIIKHYKDLEDIIEQRRHYAERETLKGQAHYDSHTLSSAEPIALAIQQDPQVTTTDEAVATPNGNSQNNNNSVLDNHPTGRPTLDKNLLNSTEDVRNRNVEALDISPTCDNILEATANFVNQTLGEKENNPKNKSTSDLDLSTKARRNANLAESAKCTSEADLVMHSRIQPWAQTPDLSRRDSALRIRRRMLREEHPIGSELAGLWGSDPTMHEAKSYDSKETVVAQPPPTGWESEISSTPSLLQLSRKSSTMLIKEKLLGFDYFGIKRLESQTEIDTVNFPTKQVTPKHNLTLNIPESTNITANKNRNKALYGATDTVTGKKKALRPDPPKFSKLTGSWIVDGGAPFQGQELFPCKQDSTGSKMESSCELATEVSEEALNYFDTPGTACKESSPRIDYSRGISINSLSSSGLLTCKSSCSFVETPSLSSSFLSSGINTACLDQSTVMERGFFQTTPKTITVTERGFPQTTTNDTSDDDSVPPCSPWLQFHKSWESIMFESPMANIADKFINLDKDQKEDNYRVDEAILATLNVSSVSEVVRKSLMFPLQTHLSVVHNNIMRMWLVHEELLSHLHSLRNYYFLLDGEFGRSVTVALFDKLGRVSKPRDLLNTDTLNTILANALAASTDSHNKNCERLSFIVFDTPAHFRHSSPNVLQDLNLNYKVTWPLNILITDDMLKKYSEVFRFLLKLWRASWTLEDAFLHLKLLNKNLLITRSAQYQQLQLYRHMMSHIITAIHGYIMSTVLQASWVDFQRDLESASTVDHIYRAHVSYIKKVMTRCLLHSDAVVFQNHLQNLFTLVLRFHGQLLSGRWVCDPKTQAYRHEHFAQLSKVFRKFQQMASYFAKLTHKLAVKGYNSHLYELHQKLNMNDYYTKET